VFPPGATFEFELTVNPVVVLLSINQFRLSSPVTATEYPVLPNAVVNVTDAFFGFPVNEPAEITFAFVVNPPPVPPVTVTCAVVPTTTAFTAVP
jgi:hypothetical protein